ncbi:MAG: cupin [Acidimicrobiales bacterium]|jgi:gentisate 1,2-dioxygenase
MAIDAHEVPGPVVLVGEATEDWTGDARFHEYSAAADPVGSGSVTPLPVERFPAALHAAPGSRTVPLDLSASLVVDYPATSPALLAAFVVLDPGDSLVTTPDATSELYYCLEGNGSSTFVRGAGAGAPSTGTIPWATGDFVTLPAGCTTEHTAGPVDRAVLYRVTDAPLLAYLGVGPGIPRFAPTRYTAAASLARLAEVERHPGAADRNRVSILLGNAALPQTLTVTHTLWAMLGVLPVDRVQRPHRHQSVALDLITGCAPGCYTMVGAEVDDDGHIVDPVRVDWEAGGAFVTPPGLWHSHHNESGTPAYLVPIQDAGLHTYLRSLDIRFTSAGN